MMFLLVYSCGEQVWWPVPAAPGYEGKHVRLERGQYVEAEDVVF